MTISWNNKIKKVFLILTGLLLLTACERIKVDPDVPLEGVGRLSIHGERYYVDRVGINMVENQVNLYIEGAEPGSKIYWSLIDPDDPADDEIIDENGSDGDDNEGKTSEFRGSVSQEGDEEYSIIDEWGQAECYFDITPKEVDGFRKFYISGDNFKVKATKDFPDGGVYTESEIFSVWKKIRKIEYDWMVTPPEATEYEDTDIFSKYPNLFSALQTFFSDETKPNRLTYVEIVNGALIDENDSRREEFNEPREWSSLTLEAIIREIDYIWKATDNVYVFSMSMCEDNPDYNGISYPISATGTNGFSVVFWWRIKLDAEALGRDEYSCAKKVLFHELGHQLVYLEDYDDFPGNHTDYNCIMRQGIDGTLIYDPHFCTGCVLNFRQYYMTF